MEGINALFSVSINQAVNNVISMAMPTNAVPAFLWQHIQCDLEVLSRAIGKGIDDSALLVHLLINELAHKKG